MYTWGGGGSIAFGKEKEVLKEVPNAVRPGMLALIT